MATPKLPTITPKKAVPGLPVIVPKAVVKSPPNLKPLVKAVPSVQRVSSDTVHNDVKADSSPSNSSDLDVSHHEFGEITENTNSIDATTGQSKPLTHATPLSTNDKDGARSSRNNSLESHFEDLVREVHLEKSNAMVNVSTSAVLKKISGSFEAKNDLETQCAYDEIGYTPWTKIEKRINEIRSLALGGFKDIAQKDKKELPKERGLYDNYNTHYEDENSWNKEAEHRLSYGTVQRLKGKNEYEPTKSNWNFVNGFVKPRRKPFTGMSELSKHFQKNDSNDQHELVKLLLICRDLEKTIEEQRTILDMLDHDLREARGILPETLTNVNMKALEGYGPQQKPGYPTSDIPLFIKGRVFLVPKGLQESGTS